MKKNKPQKYVIVSKEVEVLNRVEQDGEMVEVPAVEQQDFVKETIVIEHRKDELIARLQMEISDDDAEIARRQTHKAELEAELLELNTPSVK